MTITQLQQALKKAIETEQIGTPVALRIHLQLVQPDVALIEIFNQLVGLLEVCFSSEAKTIKADQHASGQQIQILIQLQSGATAFFTIGTGADLESKIELLLVGNHGVVKLSDANEFVSTAAKTRTEMSGWHKRVQQSLETGQQVNCEACV